MIDKDVLRPRIKFVLRYAKTSFPNRFISHILVDLILPILELILVKILGFLKSASRSTCHKVNSQEAECQYICHVQNAINLKEI